VIGPEYELQAAANGNYCLASTACIDTTGAHPNIQPCGANGTVFIADANGAIGQYLVSRYALETYSEHSLGASSIIVVDYPSEYPTPSSNLESYTGGPVFGRWAIP
jgi:hypothetical protein